MNREIKGSMTTYEIIKDKFVKKVHIILPEETPEQKAQRLKEEQDEILNRLLYDRLET